jgi:hypothetical protein
MKNQLILLIEKYQISESDLISMSQNLWGEKSVSYGEKQKLKKANSKLFKSNKLSFMDRGGLIIGLQKIEQLTEQNFSKVIEALANEKEESHEEFKAKLDEELRLSKEERQLKFEANKAARKEKSEAKMSKTGDDDRKKKEERNQELLEKSKKALETKDKSPSTKKGKKILIRVLLIGLAVFLTFKGCDYVFNSPPGSYCDCANSITGQFGGGLEQGWLYNDCINWGVKNWDEEVKPWLIENDPKTLDLGGSVTDGAAAAIQMYYIRNCDEAWTNEYDW